MIYLENTGQTEIICIPKVFGKTFDGEPFSLAARSTIDLTRVIFDNLIVDTEKSDLYYEVMTVVPENMQDGEYEYSLMAGETVVSSGILVIGCLFNPGEYNKEIAYEQYETE